MRMLLPAVLVLAVLPATTASAVTVPEIVSLTKAGVSEQIILAVIERDKTIFSIGPDQLMALQKEGVTDLVILAMLRSGRQDLPMPPAPVAAPAPYANAYDPPEPNVVVVGHGPDRPNAEDGYNGNNNAGPYVVPYFIPVPYPVPVRGPRGHRPSPIITAPITNPFAPPILRSTEPPIPTANGIFFNTPARGIFFER